MKKTVAVFIIILFATTGFCVDNSSDINSSSSNDKNSVLTTLENGNDSTKTVQPPFWDFSIGIELSTHFRFRSVAYEDGVIGAKDYRYFKWLFGIGIPISFTFSENGNLFFGIVLGFLIIPYIESLSQNDWMPYISFDFNWYYAFKLKYGKRQKNIRFMTELGIDIYYYTSFDSLNKITYYGGGVGPSFLIGLEARNNSFSYECGMFICGLFGGTQYEDVNDSFRLYTIHSVSFGFLMRFNFYQMRHWKLIKIE